MKYYEAEHTDGYARILATGKSSWSELHGAASFEDAEIRAALTEAMPHLHLSTEKPRALEYGCGTGPGACFLAERGMQVTGIDLSPVAIDIARREAKRRQLDIEYAAGDLCATRPPDAPLFDLIVDAFCLQCIVTDADREKLFAFVRAALLPGGRYVIATAGYHPLRDYGDSIFDPETGVEQEPFNRQPEDVADAVCRHGQWFLPSRRHLTLDALVKELSRVGFDTVWSRVAEHNGDIVLIAKRSNEP